MEETLEAGLGELENELKDELEELVELKELEEVPEGVVVVVEGLYYGPSWVSASLTCSNPYIYIANGSGLGSRSLC